MDKLLDIIIHMDKYLDILVKNCGPFTYLIIFMIILSETGFIITVFLPGDSLVFAAAALSAANNSLNGFILFFGFWLASILGDSLNFKFGIIMKEKVLNKHKIRFIKTEHITLTHDFYIKYGRIAIILARFMPVIRAFAPFVAAASEMKYRWFLINNIIGTFLWTAVFAGLGFFVGNIPYVKNNFGTIVLLIAAISFLPAIIAFIYTKLKKNKDT